MEKFKLIVDNSNLNSYEPQMEKSHYVNRNHRPFTALQLKKSFKSLLQMSVTNNLSYTTFNSVLQSIYFIVVMEKQDCELVNLPFYNLSDIEFNVLTGNWQYVFSSDAITSITLTHQPWLVVQVYI